jgi:prepilin-type N-terminal cleavage/methylation domain-containing protein/prepilin-type processing-associated H-X9-DG protein
MRRTGRGNVVARRDGRRGFTLVELLVVVAIVALLASILLPSLSAARQRARAATCRANLHGIMVGVHAYAAENGDCVVPSYNMRGVSFGVANPLDGWAAILDRDRHVPASREARGNPVYCPDTLDTPGMKDAQTGDEPDNPRGWMEWPTVLTLTRAFSTTIPRNGFMQIVRVSYWINGDNPIGRPETIQPGRFFTASVGFGPDSFGRVMVHNRFGEFPRPWNLIALADGLYAGNQEATRLGDRDSRIGYRHPGRIATTNVAFADGHASAIEADRFPRRLDESLDPAAVREENLGNRPTVYGDAERFLRE